MQIITAAAIKGGTGKSTTIAALAQAAAKAGKRVLAIDLDPQANLSFFVGADQNKPGSYQVLTGGRAASIIQRTGQGIHALSAAPDLATLRTTPGSAKRLQNALQPLKGDYDFVLIDTPPQIGELTYNALQASTGLIIPLETDIASVQGLYQIADIAHQMQRSNPALRISGVILTRYDQRPRLHRHLQNAIIEAGKTVDAPFLMEIRAGVSIREAQAMQQNLFDYAPHSKPAQDYRKLYEMIMED